MFQECSVERPGERPGERQAVVVERGLGEEVRMARCRDYDTLQVKGLPRRRRRKKEELKE